MVFMKGDAIPLSSNPISLLRILTDHYLPLCDELLWIDGFYILSNLKVVIKMPPFIKTSEPKKEAKPTSTQSIPKRLILISTVENIKQKV